MTERPDPVPEGWRGLYPATQVVMHAAVPLIALWFGMRALREPGYGARLAQRFGFGPVGVAGAVWVHAASLGETRGCSPLIGEVLAAGHPVLLTHLTPAGLAEGRRLFDDPRVTHRYLPLDLFWAVRRFLRRARPRLGVICEADIWPALLIEAARAGLPMVLANGNLRARAAAATGLRRRVLGLCRLFAHVLTPDEAHRQRYLAVGVDPARITVVGGLKYDQPVDAQAVAAGLRLRAFWPPGDRVLLIASSHKGEEADLAALCARLLREEGRRIIWAPRQPARFDAVAGLLQRQGISHLRRSDPAATGGGLAQVRVLLADSIGEMAAFHAMADLVFVGGSLVDRGGHNISEPMAQGRPVVMGPSTFGLGAVGEAALAEGALESLPDAGALSARIAALLRDPALLAEKSAAARKVFRAQSGAAARSKAALHPWLQQAPATADAPDRIRRLERDDA